MNEIQNYIDELKKEIEEIEKNGGCGVCKFQYGKWYLCWDCLYKRDILNAKLETAEKMKELYEKENSQDKDRKGRGHDGSSPYLSEHSPDNDIQKALKEQKKLFKKEIEKIKVKKFKPIDKQDKFHMQGWNDALEHLKELLKSLEEKNK